MTHSTNWRTTPDIPFKCATPYQFTNHLPIMSAYTTNNVSEMNIDPLLHTFQQRLRILLKAEARKHQMDAYDGTFLDVIENEIMPAVDHIVDYDPTPLTYEDTIRDAYITPNAILDVMERR